MKSLGRIGLFLVTNILIFITISIILNVLGVGYYITSAGLDYKSLAIFCLAWGMIGSFISLAMSRFMAKKLQGVKVLEPENAGELSWLVNMTHNLAKQAGLPAMPEVGVYESPVVNAFATGPTKSRSLVAYSTGILSQMNKDEIEGVAAHEIAHIQNGDMVTMTLLQGVINAFVMFFARIIAYAISERVSSSYRYLVRYGVTILLDILIGLLGLIVVSWFSRRREFRADAGSAKLAGREKMIAALEALQRMQPAMEKVRVEEPESLAAFKIFGMKKASVFSTHPPLERRIEALKQFA